MKILITGGAGFIGSYLANSLAIDNEVTVVDNLIRGEVSRLDKKVNVISLDLTKLNEFNKLDKDYHWIFHLAAVNGTDNFYEHRSTVFEVGVKSILNIYEYFKYTGASIIIASSAEVYHKPEVIPTLETETLKIPDITNARFSYGGSKIFSELLAFNYGLDFFKKVIIFRPHNIYGPDMGFKHVIPQIIMKLNKLKDENKNVLELVGGGQETRAFCYIEDAVQGLKLLMEEGENLNIYHIGNDNEEISIFELTKKIIHYYGLHNITIKKGPEKHSGGTSRRCPSIEKIKTLGYVPNIDLNKGLKRSINWYKKQPIPKNIFS